MIESSDARPNRREFCRVDVYIPMEYRLVDPEERSLVKSRISGEVLLPDFTLMPPLQDRQMEYLNQLNDKLDTIIRMLTLQVDGFHALPFKFISLSGSGIKFSSQRPFVCGDRVECKLILTLYKPVAFYLYGDVIRVERQTSGYFISIQFTAIDDLIRDKIIRFVFEMEREMLREKRCD